MASEVVPTQESKISVWLEAPAIRNRIVGALGNLIDPEFFIAQLIFALQSPEYAKCTNQSKAAAAILCAQLGLLPTLQQVALIPRYNKEAKAWELTVMVQWQGFQALMMRNNEILDMRATLVHITDQYQVRDDGLIHHVYDPFDENRKFNSIKDVKGGYLRIYYRDGRAKDHFVTAGYIDKCRQCAKTQDVWGRWFEQQCLKTLYRSAWGRRVVNFDPLVASKLQAVVEHEDRELGNDPARVMPAEIVEPQRAISRSESLLQKMRTIQEGPTVEPDEPAELSPGELFDEPTVQEEEGNA